MPDRLVAALPSETRNTAAPLHPNTIGQKYPSNGTNVQAWADELRERTLLNPNTDSLRIGERPVTIPADGKNVPEWGKQMSEHMKDQRGE